ncbi:Uncharacterized protein PECH_009007 [Penicillium ucsense]|uniref:Uncharacterized protein n=1 Tax=Penicillium ucsense TaxID=2839758 RepID=A0A8J8WGA6_9EURO|nr:Uncharacterized protein PECM_008759 [Penicillium ucsense]KAF7733727.1 Uncharacterized protein PECH_009007 [Penicillium ucsense]
MLPYVPRLLGASRKKLPDWGYHIYRTTYTTESDTLFPQAIEYIEAAIKQDFENYGGWPSIYLQGPDVKRKASAKYQSVIHDDREQFNNASIPEIRAHFEALVKSDGPEANTSSPGKSVCIMIDEESLQTLKHKTVDCIKTDMQDDRETEAYSYVKVIQWRMVSAYDESDAEDEAEGFEGWMKCWTRALWNVWILLWNDDSLSGMYEDIDESEGIYLV